MRLCGSLVATALLAALALGGQDKPVKAPDFSAKGSDGKTHTLASLTKKDKPVLFYFIGNTCPINAMAIPYFKQIEKAYKGKVNFVGVIDGDEEIYKDWNKEFKTSFTVLYDPDFEMIKKFKALASPWAVLVSPDGEIVQTMSGYSDKSLQSLISAMAKQGKTQPVKIDTSAAPEDDMFG